MAEIDTENLVPVSTDMLVGMLGNTDKLVDSNKRWNYADHKGEKNYDDELDADMNDYIDNKNNNHSKGSGAPLFIKPIDDKNNNRNHNSNREDNRDKHENHKEQKEPEYANTTTAADTTYDDSDTSHLSKKELMLLKLDMLRKLGELKQCGVHLSQNYNLDSDLDMMRYEYKLHHDIRSKQNSVQWMSHMMIGCVKGIEMLNDGYNPFDIKLGGLSDKIGSDMHNYYAVLGDIYEKYNQPGKQMAPEMRLLLMISGAALSMQVNKAVPGLGGMSQTVKSEENLTDLRQKAEADTNKNTNDYVKKQHDAAAQKAADLKMIQEKELEMKRTTKLLDTKNASNMKKFKENLILSSEAPPSRDPKFPKNLGSASFTLSNEGDPKFPKNKTDKKQKNEKEDDEEEDDEYDRTQRLTQVEIDRVRKMKYMDEQKHLDMLRRTAHAKSEMFRNNMMRNDMDEKRKRDLTRQSQQLDDIIGNIDKMDVKERSRNKSIVKPKVLKSKTFAKSESDNKSTSSTASSISINPKVNEIMKRTADKARKEGEKKYTDFSDELDTEPLTKAKSISQSSPKPPMKKLVNNTSHRELLTKDRDFGNTPVKPVINSTPKKANTNTTPNRANTKSNNLNYDIKFDEKIEMLLESNGSNFDDMSKEEISIGSRGSRGSNGGSNDRKGNFKNPKKTPDLFDFGAISIGSKTKGSKMTITSGKK